MTVNLGAQKECIILRSELSDCYSIEKRKEYISDRLLAAGIDPRKDFFCYKAIEKDKIIYRQDIDNSHA